MHSCISCSLVASRMTRMFSLRADSCCCCLSFSSDSFSPVTSLAKTVKRGRKESASEEISLSQAAKCSDYSCWDMLAGEIMFYWIIFMLQQMYLQHRSAYFASRTWTYASCCFHLRGAEHVQTLTAKSK